MTNTKDFREDAEELALTTGLEPTCALVDRLTSAAQQFLQKVRRNTLEECLGIKVDPYFQEETVEHHRYRAVWNRSAEAHKQAIQSLIDKEASDG